MEAVGAAGRRVGTSELWWPRIRRWQSVFEGVKVRSAGFFINAQRVPFTPAAASVALRCVARQRGGGGPRRGPSSSWRPRGARRGRSSPTVPLARTAAWIHSPVRRQRGGAEWRARAKRVGERFYRRLALGRRGPDQLVGVVIGDRHQSSGGLCGCAISGQQIPAAASDIGDNSLDDGGRTAPRGSQQLGGSVPRCGPRAKRRDPRPFG